MAETHLKMSVTFNGSEPLGNGCFPDYASDSLQRMNGCWRVFEDLQSLLKDLNSLPLRIRQILPNRLLLQNTNRGNATIDILELLIQFEGSASWPENLHGIQMTKTALLARLADALERADSRMRCRLRMEVDPPFMANVAFLEIVRADVMCRLRIRVYHEREKDLLGLKSKLARSGPERRAIYNALSALMRQTERSTAYVSALRRLGLRMPLLLPSIMLFHKWCSSHLLTSHLSNEFIGLLVIHIFTSPWPFTTPSNTQTALLRVLDFVSCWDWRNEPLLVNLTNNVKESHLAEVSCRFEAWRKVDPNLNKVAVFVATDIDADGTTWTHSGPAKVVASRMTALARAATAQYKDFTSPEDVRGLFATGLADFDFVLHLKDMNKKPGQQKPKTYKNLSGGTHDDELPPEHDVVNAFIMELIDAYKDVIIFFHDHGNVPFIAGVWNPNLNVKDWRLGFDYSAQPLNLGTHQVGINKDAILNDINRLGLDLVKKITTKCDTQPVLLE